MELDIDTLLNPTPDTLWAGEARMHRVLRYEMRVAEARINGNGDAVALYERRIEEIRASLKRDVLASKPLIDEALAFVIGGLEQVRREADEKAREVTA